ncbi:RsmE family RNA methyltransferase [Aquirufa sp. TARAVU-A1A]
MSKYVFFAPNPTSIGFLNEEESFHACRVLRLRSGDAIRILDGVGGLYEAVIDSIDSKKTSFVKLQLIEKQEKPAFQIHLYVAPTKQMERMEWMVEKCCEFGIHTIGFFVSKNSERKEMKLNRLEKIAIAALKQSKNLFLPKIQALAPLKQVMDTIKLGADDQALFAHISDPPVPTLGKQIGLNKSYYLFIGPEGDFSSEETTNMLKNNFTPFSLGKAILRTETACIATTHAIHLAHE